MLRINKPCICLLNVQSIADNINLRKHMVIFVGKYTKRRNYAFKGNCKNSGIYKII